MGAARLRGRENQSGPRERLRRTRAHLHEVRRLEAQIGVATHSTGRRRHPDGGSAATVGRGAGGVQRQRDHGNIQIRDPPIEPRRGAHRWPPRYERLRRSPWNTAEAAATTSVTRPDGRPDGAITGPTAVRRGLALRRSGHPLVAARRRAAGSPSGGGAPAARRGLPGGGPSTGTPKLPTDRVFRPAAASAEVAAVRVPVVAAPAAARPLSPAVGGRAVGPGAGRRRR